MSFVLSDEDELMESAFAIGISNVVIGFPVVVILGKGDEGVNDSMQPAVTAAYKSGSTKRYVLGYCRFRTDDHAKVVYDIDQPANVQGSLPGHSVGHARPVHNGRAGQMQPSPSTPQSQVQHTQQQFYSGMSPTAAIECWFLHVHRIAGVGRLHGMCKDELFIGRGTLIGQTLFYGLLRPLPSFVKVSRICYANLGATDNKRAAKIFAEVMNRVQHVYLRTHYVYRLDRAAILTGDQIPSVMFPHSGGGSVLGWSSLFTFTASEALNTLDAYLGLLSSNLSPAGYRFTSLGDFAKRVILVDMLHGIATGIHELHQLNVIVRDVSLCNVCFRRCPEEQKIGSKRSVAAEALLGDQFRLCDAVLVDLDNTITIDETTEFPAFGKVPFVMTRAEHSDSVTDCFSLGMVLASAYLKWLTGSSDVPSKLGADQESMLAQSQVEWDYLMRFMAQDGTFAQSEAEAARNSESGNMNTRRRSPPLVPFDHELHRRLHIIFSMAVRLTVDEHGKCQSVTTHESSRLEECIRALARQALHLPPVCRHQVRDS